MTYTIRSYTREKAKKLGVSVRLSENPKKKLDVYKDGEKVATIGDVLYKDYPTFLAEDKELAEKRRRAYKSRHEKTRHERGTPSWYADQLLW